MVQLGVDFSQWGGELDPLVVRAWKQAGATFAIVQYSYLMRQHLTVLTQEQLYGEIYTYLYWGLSPWGQTPRDRVDTANRIALEFNVHRNWLDCEDETNPYNESQLLDCESNCVSLGISPGIYTRRSWWQVETGDSKRFQHLPLWDARYIAEAPVADMSKLPTTMGRFTPYGGWTKAAIWQWHNSTNWLGHSVDLNVAPDAPVEPPILTPQVKDGWYKEGNFWCLYNLTTIPVFRVGSSDGLFPGRLSKLFGDQYLWIRVRRNDQTLYASPEEGD